MEGHNIFHNLFVPWAKRKEWQNYDWKIADDLIGQMTEARLIDKEMEARYVYVLSVG